MCGFVGQINVDGSLVTTESLNRAAQHIAFRGPDSRRNWQANGAAFIFNRLAIIDLDPRSDQPFTDITGRYVLVFNGEIYNHAEIRVELEAKSCTFRTNSDTEVLLYAILEWGEQALHKFNGMFAFALWDSQERRLMMARDRLGVKPMFVDLSVIGSIRFASTLGSLTYLDNTTHSLDTAALGFYFQNLYIPNPHTAFKNVIKLPPGSVGYYEANGFFDYHLWWTPQLASQKGIAVQSEGEALEQIDFLLRQAVRYRLVSDVPLGAFLSGGIDSSLIVAHMQALLPNKAKTFTIGFEEVTHDESATARAIADHLGTDHNELILSAKDLLVQIEGLSHSYDEPFADVSAIPTLLVSKLARTQVTVALSGDGGDELFGGYPYYSHAMQFQALQKMPQKLRLILSELGRIVPFPKLAMGLRALETDNPASLLAFMRSSSKSVNWQDLLHVAPLGTSELFSAASEWRGGSIPAVQEMAIDLVTYLPDDILAKVDRASMAHSLEARNPFLDRHIVEFALSQKDEIIWNSKSSKHLLRKSLKKYLPETITNLPKRGFAVPIRSWFRGPLRELIGDLAVATTLHNDPVLKRSGVERIVNEHLSGLKNHENLLWAILQYKQWKETYNIL